MESEKKADAILDDEKTGNGKSSQDDVTNEHAANSPSDNDRVGHMTGDKNSNREDHMTAGRDGESPEATTTETNRKEDKTEKDYGMSLLLDNIYFDNDIQIRPELVESLTMGFTDKFLPSLERNRKTISQIKSSQEVLIETVQQENAKFEECQANQELDQTMTKARLYHAKLMKLRKEMTGLYEKSAKLKRRALRLQQQKQKDEMTRAQQMEAEYEKEKMLTARVAPGSPEKEA